MSNLTKKPLNFIIGRLFIILGLIDIFISTGYINNIPGMSEIFPYCNYLLILKYPWGMLWGGLYLICGFGLIYRFVLTWKLSICLLFFGVGKSLARVLEWGSPGSIYAFIFQAIFVSIVIWILTRSEIEQQFHIANPRKKLHRKISLFIELIVLIIIALGPSISIISKYHEQTFITKPIPISIAVSKFAPARFRKIEMFNTSIYIPKDFFILYLKKTGEPGLWLLSATGYNSKSQEIIFLFDKSGFENFYQLYNNKSDLMGFENSYEFEKTYLSSRLGFAYAGLKQVLSNKYILLANLFGKTLKHESFQTQNCKGFITTEANNKKRYLSNFGYQVSFYTPDGDNSIEMSILCLEEHLNKSDLLNIIDSFTWLKDHTADAARYYQEGLHLLSLKDTVGAQFKFAYAYYLNSNNPEYGYIFAKSIYKNSFRSQINALEILDKILKEHPNFYKAKELKKFILADGS